MAESLLNLLLALLRLQLLRQHHLLVHIHHELKADERLHLVKAQTPRHGLLPLPRQRVILQLLRLAAPHEHTLAELAIHVLQLGYGLLLAATKLVYVCEAVPAANAARHRAAAWAPLAGVRGVGALAVPFVRWASVLRVLILGGEACADLIGPFLLHAPLRHHYHAVAVAAVPLQCGGAIELRNVVVFAIVVFGAFAVGVGRNLVEVGYFEGTRDLFLLLLLMRPLSRIECDLIERRPTVGSLINFHFIV